MDNELSMLLQRAEDLRGLVDDFMELTHYPSYGIPRPPNDSRAAILIELFWEIRKFLLRTMNRSEKGVQESKDLLEYSIQAPRIDRRFYEAGGDDLKAVNVEIEEFRPFVKQVRDFSSLNYSMLAQPFWGTGKQSIDTNAAFFSGSKDVEEKLSSVCKKLNLELMPYPSGESIANARWKQIQGAAIAVFDFTFADVHKKAEVSYELGIALTLGRPVVIIASEKYALPFDVDIVPVILKENEYDELDMKIALDLAMIWLYDIPRESHITKTLNHVLGKYFGPTDNIYINQILKLLEEQKRHPDPVNINHTINKLLDFLKDGSTSVIHPIWAPVYPEEGVFSLFHVMPFGPDWAADGMRAAQEVCVNHGIKYIRGDQVDDPNIIRSIWSEIAKAVYVLIDITEFNPNVALELGIAHTLGKKSLVVAQPDTEKDLFPMISKQRVKTYTDYVELKDILQNFLN